MSLEISPSSSSARAIAAARQADSVAFLHRAPFAFDAYKLGFLPGFREDCSYQQSQYQGLNIPVGILDNDFRNPDLDRYVARFFEHEPQVGVIGNVYELGDVGEYVAAARMIQASYPDAELVIVPKCREVIDMIPDNLVLGYSRGYADRLAHEFSEPTDWRGCRIHILGGSPPKQWDVIEQLTRPTLTDVPPADIVGLDWNGLHRGAQFGEFWTADGSTAVATLITSRFARRSATVSPVSRNSGSPTVSGPSRHHRTTLSRLSMRDHRRAISMVLRVPNAKRTSGRLSAVHSSPSTILAQSVATAVTTATSRIVIETISRRSPASRASTSRRRERIDQSSQRVAKTHHAEPI
jgi:hypothetical protein